MNIRFKRRRRARSAHLALARHERSLERALAEVQAARELAESASSIKSNFLRVMSHELKTPITAIQLQMRLLDRDPSVTPSSRVRAGLDSIARSNQRLLHLVETVLEWARVESGRCQLDVSALDLGELVAAVVADARTLAEPAGIRIECHVPAALPKLSGDRRLLRLVLLNLVGYALQRTDRGVVEILVSGSGAHQLVRVRDGGPPIPPELRIDVFSPLGASPDLHRRPGSGSGLGLYVVRDLARAIDAEISLADDGSPGNTLVLSVPNLPARRRTAAHYIPVHAAPHGGGLRLSSAGRNDPSGAEAEPMVGEW